MLEEPPTSWCWSYPSLSTSSLKKLSWGLQTSSHDGSSLPSKLFRAKHLGRFQQLAGCVNNICIGNCCTLVLLSVCVYISITRCAYIPILVIRWMSKISTLILFMPPWSLQWLYFNAIKPYRTPIASGSALKVADLFACPCLVFTLQPSFIWMTLVT